MTRQADRVRVHPSIKKSRRRRRHVAVVRAEDPVEEHGQPHPALRDPARHDRQPRVKVVVCREIQGDTERISQSAALGCLMIHCTVVDPSVCVPKSTYRTVSPLRGRRCTPICTPGLCSRSRTCCIASTAYIQDSSKLKELTT